jgi:hypothetical protein
MMTINIDYQWRNGEYEQLAEVLVAEWVENYLELLPCYGTENPQLAFDLVAGWARLCRAAPDKIQAVCQLDVRPVWRLESPAACPMIAPELAADESGFAARLVELTRAALTVLRPIAWIQQLDELETQWIDSDDEQAPLTQAVIELLSDLDDAELVLWTAAALCPDDNSVKKLELLLDIARQSMQDRLPVFWDAALWVRGLLRAVNHELEDPLGRATLEKFRRLDAYWQEVEEHERGAGPRLPDSVAQLLRAAVAVAAAAKTVTRIVRAIASARQRQLAAAASVESSVALPYARWQSPDRCYQIELQVPAVVGRENVPEAYSFVVKRLERAGGTSVPGAIATDFAGRHVQLRVGQQSLESTFDSQGCAIFASNEIESLLESAHTLQLLVKHEGTWQEWTFIAN